MSLAPPPGIGMPGSMAGLLKLSSGASEPSFRLNRRSPAPVSDRELGLKVQKIILAPATHTRRKIWEFDPTCIARSSAPA